MRFRIVCTTERNELRLRIEEAQVIPMMKPAINRRGEETGIYFLAWTLPPEDKQVMLFCTATQWETKEPALTLNSLKQPVAIKRKFFLYSSLHPSDDGVDLRNVWETTTTTVLDFVSVNGLFAIWDAVVGLKFNNE